MIKVGITGNIGSGKSLICFMFERLNVPVFSADSEARKLYSHADIKKKIKSYFGEELFDENDHLVTSLLAKTIFANKEDLNFVNGLIHPAVRERYNQWLGTKSKDFYTLYEAAILFETGYNKDFHKIIFVSAPETVRFQRLIERDKSEPKLIEERMRNQWPESQKLHLADFVIVNDGKTHLVPQVIEIHKRIIAMIPH